MYIGFTLNPVLVLFLGVLILTGLFFILKSVFLIILFLEYCSLSIMLLCSLLFFYGGFDYLWFLLLFLFLVSEAILGLSALVSVTQSHKIYKLVDSF